MGSPNEERPRVLKPTGRNMPVSPATAQARSMQVPQVLKPFVIPRRFQPVRSKRLVLVAIAPRTLTQPG